MDHAVDFVFEADEQAKFGGVLDFAFDGGTDRMGAEEVVPGVVLGLLQAERHAALGGVDFEHDDFNFLRSGDDLARMDVLLGPRHFRNVHQTFNARLEFDEGAVVSDVGDATGELGRRPDTSGQHHPTDRTAVASCRG